MSCRHETKNRRYFRDMHVNNASLLAIHIDKIQITNGTDAGRPSSWRHRAGMQKTDCIPINSTFLVGWMNRNTDSHGLLFVVPFGRIIVPYTTVDMPYYIPHTLTQIHTHTQRNIVTKQYETNIVECKPVLLLSFLNCNSYVCQSYPLLANALPRSVTF